MEQNKAFDNILSDLAKLRDEKTVEVRLPSTGAKYNVRVLSAEQQKLLIQTGMEKNAIKTAFISELINILKTNSNGAIRADDVLNIDRYSIFYAIKSAFISDKITLSMDDDEANLSTVLEANKDFLFPEELKKQDFKIGNYTVTLAPYSLFKDKVYSSSLEAKIGASEKQGKVIGEIYIYELAKYIKEIKIGENILTENDLKPSVCLDIISQFPTNLLAEFIQYINKIKKVEENYAIINGYRVDIDGKFFV